MATRKRNQNGSRKRGVRASRARLYHALTEAGFRSQAALAERMAELEGLEQAPKDLVNRVFREQPVELQTLERVARALGVEAWELYLTSDEPPEAVDPARRLPQTSTHQPPPSPRRRSPSVPLLMAIGLLALTGLAGAVWWLTPGDGPSGGAGADGDDRMVFTTPSPAWLSRPTLVVMPTFDEEEDMLTEALREALSQHFRLASPTAELLAHGREAGEVAAQLGSDAVVEGEIVRVGRLAGVRIHLFRGGVRQQVWGETVDVARLDHLLADVATNATAAVGRALGLPVGEPMAHYPLAPVQDYYLEGRLYLDGPASELNIRRAQGRFEATLRLDANYADAQAGLCEALLEEYWMEDAQRALNDASLACSRAIQLAPWAASTRIAHAHLLRVTGRADEAVAILEDLLLEDPDDAHALVGLVASRLALYRGSGEVAQLELALAAAQHGTAVDPGFWKPPFWQASLAYFAGDLAGAIEAAEEARRRDENEYVLANLGTFYFCAEELERAREVYERARVVAPHSYVGDEFLSIIHYLTGEFDMAAELRARAIERLSGAGEPEIHEMWGNLGDAYLASGRREAAIEAYQRAAEITERDVLQGIDSPADRASRAYYYSRLAKLAPERLPPGATARIERDLRAALDEPLEAGAAVRVAKAWLQRERPELALRAFEQAVARCGGYASTPALATLRPMLGTGELSASP
ncbi:MAG: tetratricopeptide repeat protein [Gammaproteobacteria bacterium]|nr:tetratricopeptide repeat protein [Gammaproteobacteria bacterium]